MLNFSLEVMSIYMERREARPIVNFRLPFFKYSVRFSLISIFDLSSIVYQKTENSKEKYVFCQRRNLRIEL
jgi:hypothetical protein